MKTKRTTRDLQLPTVEPLVLLRDSSKSRHKLSVTISEIVYTNKAENPRIRARSFIQFLVSVSLEEIVESRKDHNSQRPGKGIFQRGPKLTIQAASSTSTLPPAPPRQPTPNPNHIQPPHMHLQQHTRQCPQVRDDPYVHPLRGIDRVGPPVCFGSSLRG